MTAEPVTLFHAPNTRSSSVLLLLEALGAPYKLHVLNTKKGENHAAAYLAINPLGKVPAIQHGDAIITEAVACFLYLADEFPAASLAPTIGDPLRGPYLRWMALYGSTFEPAIIDRAMKRDPGQRAMSAYGDFDALFKTITDQLSKGTYLLGEKMTAADILWSSGLGWTTLFKIFPEHPAVAAYLAHCAQHPALARQRQKDAELAASLS